jgi:DNA-binding FadR family transcriptional regulator
MESAFVQMSKTKRLGTRYREYRRFIQEDTRFHQAIVESSGNPATISIYANLHAVLVQSRLYATRTSADGARAQQVLDEHGAILDAFRAGDGEAAERAIRQHLEGGRRRLLSGPPEAPVPQEGEPSA